MLACFSERDLLDLSNSDGQNLFVGVLIERNAAFGLSGADLSWCSSASTLRHTHPMDHKVVQIEVFEGGDGVTCVSLVRLIIAQEMVGLLENEAAAWSTRDREVSIFIIEVQQNAPVVGDPLKKLNIPVLVFVIILVGCDSILPGLEAVHVLDVQTLIQSVRDDANGQKIILGGITLPVVHRQNGDPIDTGVCAPPTSEVTMILGDLVGD